MGFLLGPPCVDDCQLTLTQAWQPAAEREGAGHQPASRVSHDFLAALVRTGSRRRSAPSPSSYCYDEYNFGYSMTTDERLEKLAERHEVLTQAVDLLADMLQQNERRMAQVLDAINRLANIAEAHDVRLDDHERSPGGPSRAA